MEAGYVLAFTTGILGGFGHCIGMCGPLVGAYTLADRSGPDSLLRRIIPHLLYNSGRIITYSLIGSIMGFAGSFVNAAGRIAGIQNAVAVLSGLIMIMMGISIAGVRGSNQWLERHNRPFLLAARRMGNRTASVRFLGLGLLLGLLPCGLSYSIFIAAAGSGGAIPGMITALLFGIGTAPALVSFGFLVSSLGARIRGNLYRAGGVLIVITGMYFLWRGFAMYAGL